MDSNAPRVHPQHALAVYAESLATGARVAVLGDASLGLAARLLELGARSVHVWDPDTRRASVESEGAPRGVTVRGYSDLDPEARPVDLALVADLGLFDDPGSVVRRVRRMVGEEGVAVIAARNAEGGADESARAFDYYDFFDLVAPEFESVRMVAQLPFHGLALVALGEEDESPAVNVDTQLGESGRAPESFVVVASQRDVRLDAYAIVQLPAPPPPREPFVSATTPTPSPDAGEMERDSLVQAEMRNQLLAGQLDELRARLAELERVAAAVPSLEDALRARAAQASDAERALSLRGRELAELSNEVEEMRATAEAGRIAAAQVEEMAVRADRAERRVALLDQELATGGDAQLRELAEMEQALRERAAAVRVLEAEIGRRDRMVRDLVSILDDAGLAAPVGREGLGLSTAELDGVQRADAAAGAMPDGIAGAGARGPAADAVARAIAAAESSVTALSEENARLRAQLDALALDLARREGDAQATVWQIGELERRAAQAEAARAELAATVESPVVEAAPAREVSGPRIDPKLAQALDELDTLRTALSQEHEARERAESGEELARARAEIERQAVLMEQLVRELGARPSASKEAAREPSAYGGSGGASGGGREGAPSGSSEDSR